MGIGSRDLRLAIDLVPLEAIANQAANADFGSFVAPFSGTATVMLSLTTSSVVNLMAKPSGGAEGNLGAINSGASLPASEPQSFQFPISSGVTYAFQVATAQAGNLTAHVKGVPR